MSKLIRMNKTEEGVNKPRIKVIGIGECGNNAVERMIHKRVRDVQFISIDMKTDVLLYSNADIKIQIGRDIMRGMGCANPEFGRKAAQESAEKIKKHIQDADMVIIVCGMGGGTGTGAAPVVAQIAKSLNILTIAAVTRSFEFEGKKRAEFSEEGIRLLKENVDTLIMIRNDNVIKTLPKQMTLGDAFLHIDDLLRRSVQSVTDSMLKAEVSRINFDEVKHLMCNSGTSAQLCIGLGQGENAYTDAVKNALEHPLDTGIDNAEKAFLYIAGGKLDIESVNEICELIHVSIKSDDIFVGISTDEELGDEICVTLIAV